MSLSTRHEQELTNRKEPEKPKTTSNNQHPTSRKAPRSKHQRTTAESHIQSGEVWQLGLGAWIFFGLDVVFPGRQSAAFRLQKPLARGRNPMPFACIGGPCSPKRAPVAPFSGAPSRFLLPQTASPSRQRPSPRKGEGRVSVVGFAVLLISQHDITARDCRC